VDSLISPWGRHSNWVTAWIDQTRFIPLTDILELNEEIGQGFFGKVYIGKFNGKTVAAKKLNTETDKFDTEFWQEVDVLLGLSHKNIVRFVGVTSLNGGKYLLTEFANKGEVKSYLSKKTKEEITRAQIVKMSLDTAEGMTFISRLNIVHRDLAVRNLLCSEMNGELVVKVADFGLSRRSSGDILTISDKSADPIRWAAPETFTGKVSTQSDIWSFGVTLWELFTFCKSEPYAELNNQKVKQSVTSGNSVMEFFKLKDAPKEINDLLESCLQFEPSKRPTFKVISSILNGIKEKLEGDSAANIWEFPNEGVKDSVPDYGEGTYETSEQDYNE